MRMAVHLSEDDGQTWSPVRLLNAGPAALSCPRTGLIAAPSASQTRPAQGFVWDFKRC